MIDWPGHRDRTLPGMEPRYDAVAQWYADFTREWSPVCLPYLPDDLHQQHVLDLACGSGVVSTVLAERGATVTAVDASSGMLDNADLSDRVTYQPGDATNTDWWDGRRFDGLVCNMALMDIDDLAAALSTIATVTAPGGWILLSLLHPCFPGRTDTGTMSSWPPDGGYTSEGWWATDTDGIRSRVGAHHRMLSTYLNAVLAAGLNFEEFIEPPADVPRYLVLRCSSDRNPNVGRGVIQQAYFSAQR